MSSDPSPSIYRHLTALADPVRVRLLRLLEEEELGVGELARIVQLPQSTVSRHLKVLREEGWLQRRQVATASLLRVEPAALPEDAQRLWEVVRAEVDTLYRADRERMQSVLALRKDASAEFFERSAERWDAVRRDLFGDAFLLPTLLSLLPDGLVVADLGCGTGWALAELAPAVKELIGIDRESAMLEIAARRVGDQPNVRLLQGNLSELPLADGTIDAALCMLVLHHLLDPAAVLAEARRILKPGGRLLLLDLVEHDRDELRETMGHRHLGFSRDALAALAADACLTLRRYRPLPAAPEALGPGLFVAILEHTGTC